MFGVTTMRDSSVPAALVRDGANLVLVLREGLLPDDVIAHLDRLLDAGLSPLIADALAEADEDGDAQHGSLTGAATRVAATGTAVLSLAACSGLG